RMQNFQYYSPPAPVEEKVSGSNLRRNLAFSLAALLVFVIASSGTAAASSQAMPDEPLYGVKMAVEQAQLTLTTSDVDKAELYARLAEKRAQEIAVMADKGKTDQVVATTAKLNYQLDQADDLLAKYEAALAASGAFSNSSATTAVTPPPLPLTPPFFTAVENATAENVASVTAPVQPPTAVSVENATVENSTTTATADNKSQAGSKRLAAFSQGLNDVDKATTDIDASTDKSLTILQNALDKAPESVKSSLTDAIERTKKARARITSLQTSNQTSRQTQTSTTSVTNANADNSTKQKDTNRSFDKHQR
ncbi:MAG: DUF5667 domain-containing protein, partial [Dehalococcoidia bacterium]